MRGPIHRQGHARDVYEVVEKAHIVFSGRPPRKIRPGKIRLAIWKQAVFAEFFSL